MNYEYIKKLERICAFLPCYLKDEGKATKLCYKGGGYEYINYSVKKILTDYCALNLRSVESLKKLSRNITGCKSLFPLYIEEEDTFMPIKTVKPITKGDNCIGYINMRYIEGLDFQNKKVILTNGDSICYLEGKETIKKRIADCTIINKRVNIKKQKMLN